MGDPNSMAHPSGSLVAAKRARRARASLQGKLGRPLALPLPAAMVGPVLGFSSRSACRSSPWSAWAWAAVRRGTITPAVTVRFGTFAFSFALPAMLLRLMAAQPLAQSFEPRFFGGYLGACLLIFFATMAGAMLLAGRRRGQAAAIAAAAAMGNVGYLGPPLLLPLLGERGAGPVAMAIMSEVAIVIALGSVLMAPIRERGVARPGAAVAAAEPGAAGDLGRRGAGGAGAWRSPARSNASSPSSAPQPGRPHCSPWAALWGGSASTGGWCWRPGRQRRASW